MSVRILGAGFGRTGTNSLKEALEILGFGPCYHMHEVAKNPCHVSIWNRAIDEKEVDWQDLFKGYQSAVDWPTISFLPKLLHQYPHAKVVLTLRDPEQWFESASNTIFEAMALGEKNPDITGRNRTKMSRRLILEKTFSGRYAEKEYCIKIYNQHIQDVISLVPSDKLLHYRISDGWKPLCDFLNVSVPSDHFPKTNDRKSFLSTKPQWAKKANKKDQYGSW